MKTKYIDSGSLPMHYHRITSTQKLAKTKNENGREYQLLGVAEKKIGVFHRIGLGIRSIGQRIFSCGKNEKANYDWATFLAGKRRVAFYTLSAESSDKKSQINNQFKSKVNPDPSNEGSAANSSVSSDLDENKDAPSKAFKSSNEGSAADSSVSSDLDENKDAPSKAFKSSNEGFVADSPVSSDLDENKDAPSKAFKSSNEGFAADSPVSSDLDENKDALSKAFKSSNEGSAADSSVFSDLDENKDAPSKAFKSLSIDSLNTIQPKSSKPRVVEGFFSLAYLSTLPPVEAAQQLQFLNPKEAIDLFDVFAKKDKEVTVNFINTMIKCSLNNELYGYREKIDAILPALNDSQLYAFACSLIEYPENYLELRDNVFKSIDIERFKTVVDQLTIDQLNLLLENVVFNNHREQQEKYQLVLLKLLAPVDTGELLYNLYLKCEFNQRHEFVRVIKKDPVKYQLLVQHIQLLANKEKGYEQLNEFLTAFCDDRSAESLELMRKGLGDKLSSFSKKFFGESLSFSQIRVNLCVLLTFQVFENKNLSLQEKMNELAFILESLNENDSVRSNELNNYASNPNLIVKLDDIPILISCFIKAKKLPGVLVEGWMKKILMENNAECMRVSFMAYWQDIRTLPSEYLSFILPHINTRQKLNIALYSIPENWPEKDRKLYINILQDGAMGTRHGITQHFRVLLDTEKSAEEKG